MHKRDCAIDSVKSNILRANWAADVRSQWHVARAGMVDEGTYLTIINASSLGVEQFNLQNIDYQRYFGIVRMAYQPTS
jgi:hypothetical protein